MTDKVATKNKGGRPRNPPPAPALGIAERSGQGWKFTIVLGGLKINGNKMDPQSGAELLAGMLEDGMRRITPAASPEKALRDLEAADAASEVATGGSPAAPLDLAMAPGENGNH